MSAPNVQFHHDALAYATQRCLYIGSLFRQTVSASSAPSSPTSSRPHFCPLPQSKHRLCCRTPGGAVCRYLSCRSGGHDAHALDSPVLAHSLAPLLQIHGSAEGDTVRFVHASTPRVVLRPTLSLSVCRPVDFSRSFALTSITSSSANTKNISIR